MTLSPLEQAIVTAKRDLDLARERGDRWGVRMAESVVNDLLERVTGDSDTSVTVTVTPE